MFDYQNLDVYHYAKEQNKDIRLLLKNNRKIDYSLKNQLERASLSIVLNIAEGSGRNGRDDRRRFFIISRGSAYECSAILEIIYEEKMIVKSEFEYIYNQLVRISKMLFGLIKKSESNYLQRVR